jgi:predicted TIM-barrel fold metal-dependent hydrolase
MTVTDPTTEPAEEATLPYRLTDADEHSTPRRGAHMEYMDPDKKHLAITYGSIDEKGRPQVLYAGKPARLQAKNFQVTFSDDKLEDVGVSGAGRSDEDMGTPGVVPGSLLNKLNPLKTMDAEARKDFAKQYRKLQPMLDNPADRLSVMDMQNVEACVNYAAIATEYEFEDNWEALYANQRAENRYLAAEWGYNYEQRIFTPPCISTVDAELAIAELDNVMNAECGAPKVIQLVAGPSIHRSPFRPEMEPFWARLNEAHIKICTHLSTVTFYGRQGLEWDEDEVMLGDMNAFQWMMYYGDRPAYETVAAAILQGLFAKYPNIQLLLSEQGTVWVPYIVRKMDHAFLMGRRGSFDRKLEMRPSEYFKKHIKVAPYPEENVDRIIEAVGEKPITFGSDFPHGEGLPDPMMYLSQLKNCTPEQTKAIMRDNLAEFLGLEP